MIIKIGIDQGKAYMDLLANSKTPSFELKAFILMITRLRTLIDKDLDVRTLDSGHYDDLKFGIRIYYHDI